MKKRSIIIPLLICAMIVFSAGCGKKTSEPVPEAVTSDSSEPSEQPEESVIPDDTSSGELPEESSVQEAPSSSVIAAESINDTEYAFLHPTITTCRNNTYNESGRLKVMVTYDKLSLDQSESAKYPELAKALGEAAEKTDKYYTDRASVMDSDYESLKSDGFSFDDKYFSDEMNISVTRADSYVLSIASDEYYDGGGAHPNFTYSASNYDTQTGALLSLTDVVTDPDEFLAVVEDKMSVEYPEVYSSSGDTLTEYLESEKKNGFRDLVWSMSCEGITVYFSTYTLGSYAEGDQVITVFFDEKPELFEEKYTDVPDSYILKNEKMNEVVRIDTDNDGKREAVYIEREADEYDYFFNWIIHVGDKALTVSDYCYEYDYYIVRSDGRYYMYLFQTGEDDYSTLVVIDLKEMAPVDENSRNLYLKNTLISYDYTDEGSYFITEGNTLTDPARMILSTNQNVLGTYSGFKTWHIGSNGVPVTDETYYTSSCMNILTALSDIHCQAVDAAGNIISDDEIIPAGTQLFIVRTDGSVISDIQEVDPSIVAVEDYDDWQRVYTVTDPEADYSKKLYRITYDTSEWPRTINGINEDELFDGIMYAG